MVPTPRPVRAPASAVGPLSITLIFIGGSLVLTAVLVLALRRGCGRGGEVLPEEDWDERAQWEVRGPVPLAAAPGGGAKAAEARAPTEAGKAQAGTAPCGGEHPAVDTEVPPGGAPSPGASSSLQLQSLGSAAESPVRAAEAPSLGPAP